MTKTDRSTLIATVLLGVLLYTVLRFAHDLNLAWDGSVLEPPPDSNDQQASEHPRIANASDLQAFLTKHHIDAATMLDDYTRWSDARGFTGSNRLFASHDVATVNASVDEAQLIEKSAAGDANASQTLASRRLFVDALRSIDLYRRAAEQGSTYALLRISSLLAALEAAPGNETTDPERQQRIGELRRQGVSNSLHLTALGYIITAIRDGGAPIVDPALLEQLDRLNRSTTPDEQVAVCEWSERTLLDVAKGRVRQGKPAITTDAPRVFFVIPDLDTRLPCARSAHPIENLMDFTGCTTTRVRNDTDHALDLYTCPAI